MSTKRKIEAGAILALALFMASTAVAQIYNQVTTSNTVTVTAFFNVDTTANVNGIYYNPTITVGQTSITGSGTGCTAAQSGGLTTITCPNPNSGVVYGGDSVVYSIDIEAAKSGIVPTSTVCGLTGTCAAGFTAGASGTGIVNSTYYQTSSTEGLGGTAGPITAGLPATMTAGQWYFVYVDLQFQPTAQLGSVTFTTNIGTTNA